MLGELTGMRTPRHQREVALLAVLLLSCGLACGGARPFTIADSIALTRFVDPEIALEEFKAPRIKFSPNGDRFVVVTRAGNLSTGENIYSLLIFDVADVRAFVNDASRTELPRPDVLAQLGTSTSRNAIDQVKWLPQGAGIAFVGAPGDAAPQVFTVDFASHVVRQHTRDPEGVATFDFAWPRQKILYTAYVLPDWVERNRHGYAITSEYLGLVVATNPRDAVPTLKHCMVDLVTNQTSELAIERTVVPQPVTVSPDGRWAVVYASVRKLPARWRDYETIRDYLQRAAAVEAPPSGKRVASRESDTPAEFIQDDAFDGPGAWLNQFQLVDLATGAVRPFFDAPSMMLSFLPSVSWSSDSRSVVLSATALPLKGVDADERARRTRAQAVVEVELATMQISRVMELQADSADSGELRFVTDVRLLRDGQVEVSFHSHGNTQLLPKRFRKRGDQWIEIFGRVRNDTMRHLADSLGPLQVEVTQDMNTPPELVALDRRSGRRRIITDLNPQLRELTLGRVSEFEWSDRLGRNFTGGLVLPPSFRDGGRYPAVIQTYGFRKSEFLVDGPNGLTTAYSAQALANRDIIVLQVPYLDSGALTPQFRFEDDGENPRFVAGLEGAIDALAARGLIDPARVGLIGFSREGMHVHYAVTFSTYPIAVATIADSVLATPMTYVMVYGFPYPGMLEFENPRLIGAPFWGDGIKLWLERSPTFHLDRIHTPLRYEHIGSGPPPFWETFAILKRHRKPVEMIHIPKGSHVLETPYERYTSQQGNVDWFAFWLKGEEDTDPAKAGQYQRWRKLRDQHEADLARPASLNSGK